MSRRALSGDEATSLVVRRRARTCNNGACSDDQLSVTIELLPASQAETPVVQPPPSAPLVRGLPMTFVASGCPILVTRFGLGLDVRLSGRVVAANCAQVERVLLGAMASAVPVRLVLVGVELIDASGAAMLAGILDASVVMRSPWSIVDLDPVVHDGCIEWRGCACSRLRSSIELAPGGGGARRSPRAR